MTLADPLEDSFARTWRMVAVAKLRAQSTSLVVLVILFAAWLVWLVLGRVSIYASSQQAHFEADHFPQPIQAAVDGVVVMCNLSLSQRVHEHEVLLSLDARTYELQLLEAQANLRSDETAIVSLESEIGAQQKARDAIARLVNDSQRVGNARVAVSQTAERFQQKEADVLKKLNEKELASKLDQLHAESQNETTHAQVAASSAEAKQATSLQVATLYDRDVQISALNKLLTDAQSRRDVLLANIETTTYEVERRRVRATASGTLADISPCVAGMTVTPDRKLATLLPDSKVRVAAWFKPEDAVGRVQIGQSATLRVDNFPWTQFGTVGATVERVGSEPRDGLVRVELAVTNPNPSIPIMHGLTGVTEIQIERISPFQLLLRTIGERLSPTRSSPDPSGSSSATGSQG